MSNIQLMPGKFSHLYKDSIKPKQTPSQNQTKYPRNQVKNPSYKPSQKQKIVKKPEMGIESITPDKDKKVTNKENPLEKIDAIHPDTEKDEKTTNKFPASDVKSSQKNSRKASPRTNMALNPNFKKDPLASSKNNSKSSLQKVTQPNKPSPQKANQQSKSSLQKANQQSKSSPQKANQQSKSSPQKATVRTGVSKISSLPSPRSQLKKKRHQDQQNQEQIHEQDKPKESKEEPINVQNKNEVHFEQPQQVPVITNNNSNAENDLKEKRINELISDMDIGFNNISKILKDDIFKEIDIPGNLVYVEDV